MQQPTRSPYDSWHGRAPTLPWSADAPRLDCLPRKISKQRAMREIGPVVYALKTPDGCIKIGYTGNLANRSHTLRATQILAVKPGTLADEQAIHTTLRGHVARGEEYYHPHPDVWSVVNEMRRAVGMDALPG